MIRDRKQATDILSRLQLGNRQCGKLHFRLFVHAIDAQRTAAGQIAPVRHGILQLASVRE